MKPGWEVVNGVPYYRAPGRTQSGGRQRGKWCRCQECGAEFPTAVANLGTYCSKPCAAKHWVSPIHIPHARQDLFATWTAEESWLAGLIWADGCLSEHPARRTITIVSTDVELADHAARISGAPKRAKKPGPRRKIPYTVNITGRPVIDRLVEYGLAPRKSCSAPLPLVPNFPDFVRGYFDGDGTVGLYRNPNVRRASTPPRLVSGFVGSHQMMSDLQPILEQAAGISPKKLYSARTVSSVQYNHADSIRLFEYMYSGDGPCLTRKRAIFEAGMALT